MKYVILCVWIHKISIPNYFKIAESFLVPRVCVYVSFWISCGFFHHSGVVHLRLELLSIARRESLGWDWLRAPFIRVGTIYPPRIGYIGQFRERYSFCSCRSFVSPGLVSISFSYSPRIKKGNDRTNWKQFIKILPYSICVSLSFGYRAFAISLMRTL